MTDVLPQTGFLYQFLLHRIIIRRRRSRSSHALGLLVQTARDYTG
jgi:hypothetical protein